MPTRRPAVVALLAVAAAGCGRATPTAPPPTTAVAAHAESPGHSHDRGHLMIVDAGKHHAALTAHLSSNTGNELDVFLETADAAHTPVAVPDAPFPARAVRDRDGSGFDLRFEPAPADERPKDEPAGRCSHFVAKAPDLTPDEAYTVTATIPVDGTPREVTWKGFVPRKYAHVVE